MKRIVARAVHFNRGTEARYRRALAREIAAMVRSVEYWLAAQRRSDPPVLAEDASPSARMNSELKKLSSRWKKRFDEMADKVARIFLVNQFRGTDNAMRRALVDVGWSVEFTMTPAVRDAFEASLAENVGLIRSIPAQYLQKVEGIVMRGYARGGDLQTMVREIQHVSGVTKKRAIFIARDQASKANAVVTRARQKEIGVTEGIWMHSHAGVTPRPTHVAMNGKRYSIEKGMYDSHEKEYVFPGELINCRCTGRSVLPWTPAQK